jgi:hypothetical protein
MKKITFITDPINIDAIPYPVPAGKYTPDWFKSMGPKADVSKKSLINNVTMKVCPGVHDIFNVGYIIPAWCDFYIDITGGGLKFESSNNEQFLTVFPPPTSPGFPFPKTHQPTFFKFKTPWRIQSADPLTALVSQPKYQFDLPYQVYEGVMDIGPYVADLNFIISMEKNRYLEFKRGDPLLHVIPFSNDHFKASVGPIDDSLLLKLNRQMQAIKSYALGGYFKTLHKKKSYE